MRLQIVQDARMVAKEVRQAIGHVGVGLDRVMQPIGIVGPICIARDGEIHF